MWSCPLLGRKRLLFNAPVMESINQRRGAPLAFHRASRSACNGGGNRLAAQTDICAAQAPVNSPGFHNRDLDQFDESKRCRRVAPLPRSRPSGGIILRCRAAPDCLPSVSYLIYSQNRATFKQDEFPLGNDRFQWPGFLPTHFRRLIKRQVCEFAQQSHNPKGVEYPILRTNETPLFRVAILLLFHPRAVVPRNPGL